MSLCAGAARIDALVSKAVERGHKALAITDYGNVRGVYDFMIACQDQPLKPIYGIEFFVCGDHKRRGMTPEERAAITDSLPRSQWNDALRDYEAKHGIMDLDLLTCWAIDDDGIKNLFKLSSRAWVDGFYYKPRIDLNLLEAHNKGLAIGTGCPESVIHRRAAAGRRREALDVADRLWETFGPDRLWVELMPHPLLKQAEANQFALELLDRWGKKARPLATQDVHYINEGEHVYQKMYASFISGQKPDESGLPGESYWFKTRAEMEASFKDFHDYIPDKVKRRALDNTVTFADECTAKLVQDKFACFIPDVYVPPDLKGDEFAYLKRLCTQGWTWREVPRRAAEYAKHHKLDVAEVMRMYTERLAKELLAFKRQKFIGYLLLVHELYDWVRKQGIACGPGRGSAAGSMVNFLIGITSVDPIEHGLLFERFISPDRVDMPDIDMDFEDERRDEILVHLREKYGVDRVCQIATIIKLKGKACIRDVGRSLDIPDYEIAPVTKAILERSSGDERASMTIEDSFKEFEVCRDFDKKHPEVLQYAKKLEGLGKALGMHAAGVITAPKPLEEMIPLETREHGKQRVVVSAFDMYGSAAFGLLKLDVLGLRTMTVLRLACEAIKRRHGVTVDLEQLPLNEPDVLQGFTDHDYVGIFQYDSPGADKICMGVQFTHFEDVAAMTALNRPGTARSGLATQYVARKKNPKLVSKTAFHPSVSEITADTLGIIVYQEHVIKIFTDVAGFHPTSADSLRKKIAKKLGDELIGKERETFIKGAMEKTGMDRETASKIMDAITFFGSYGFNKSHATAYGMIAYWGMWLKIRYPIEFYWALLTCEPDQIKIQRVVKDARKHKIKVVPSDVSRSRAGFNIDDAEGVIVGSLTDIKGVGNAAADSIVANQPFTSFTDFMTRIERRKVNKGVVLALMKAGAMDRIIPNIKFFLDHSEDLWKLLSKSKTGLDKVQALIDKSGGLPDYSKEERVLVAAKVSPLAFGKHPVEAYKDFIRKHVKVPITSMGAEDFYEMNDSAHVGGVFICGIIVEIKLNQVGDFHTGPEPDENEKQRMGWGRRYANINIEDKSGRQNRVKFDWDIYDDMRHIVDAGIGTPVIAHVTVNAKFTSMKCHFAISLEEYRKHVKAEAALSLWERVIAGEHPALTYPWKTEANAKFAKRSLDELRAIARTEAKKAGKRDIIVYRAIGVVTHVKVKPDKKMNNMGFFGLLGVRGYIDVAAWASTWPSIRKHVKVGQLIDIELEYGGWSSIYNGDTFRVLTNPAKSKRKE